MARDLGRFVSGAQRTVEEFKDELVPKEVDEACRAVEETKNEAQRSLKGIIKAEIGSDEDRDGPTTPSNGDRDKAPRRERELPGKEEASPALRGPCRPRTVPPKV